MKGHVARFLLALAVAGLPTASQAGWVVQLRNTTVKTNGERQQPENATMYVSEGKVRTVQPASISVIDYKKGRFTLLNPKSVSFWSGSVDEYVEEVKRNRKKASEQRLGAGSAAQMSTTQIDDSKLPKIVVREIGPGGTIAGHETVKYQIESNGEVFQEVWLAKDVNLAPDLDPKSFLAYQQKVSGIRIGKAALAMRAAYKSQEVRALYEKGFLIQTITHHLGGKFERVTTEVQRSEIPDKEFEVPENYRRVRLADVFPTEGES